MPELDAGRNALFSRQPRGTIPDGIAREIQGRIDRGQLAQGDRLPSVDALALDFGVGRTSVREALQGLAALGIVEMKHGRGTFVRARSDWIDTRQTWIRERQYALVELCELRLAIETTAASLAAVKATQDDLDEIETALLRMQSATSAREVASDDTAFHAAVIQAAHNSLLDQAMSLNADFLAQARLRMHTGPDDAAISLAAHQRILDAISARAPEKAERMMREHLRAVERGLGIHLP